MVEILLGNLQPLVDNIFRPIFRHFSLEGEPEPGWELVGTPPPGGDLDDHGSALRAATSAVLNGSGKRSLDPVADLGTGEPGSCPGRHLLFKFKFKCTLLSIVPCNT